MACSYDGDNKRLEDGGGPWDIMYSGFSWHDPMLEDTG